MCYYRCWPPASWMGLQSMWKCSLKNQRTKGVLHHCYQLQLLPRTRSLLNKWPVPSTCFSLLSPRSDTYITSRKMPKLSKNQLPSLLIGNNNRINICLIWASWESNQSIHTRGSVYALKMLLVLLLLLPDVDQSHQFRESQRIKLVTMWALKKKKTEKKAAILFKGHF